MTQLKDRNWDEFDRTSHDGKIYRQEDLDTDAFRLVIADAAKLWHKRVTAYYKEHGDTGSCIMGDGIMIAVRPPRRRNTFKYRILAPPGGFGMGSGPYEGSAPEVVDFLKARGVDCWYDYGHMD